MLCHLITKKGVQNENRSPSCPPHNDTSMSTSLLTGIHHVTATVDQAQEDFHFYTQILGLRLVKKTVNFDHNQVYHLYYGNETGEPGTIMTTFPYRGQGIRVGTSGTGQVARTAFSVPLASMDFWEAWLNQQEIPYHQTTQFGAPVWNFDDPSGLPLALVGTHADIRAPYLHEDFSEHTAIRGIHHVELLLASAPEALEFLTTELGFETVTTEGNTTRLKVNGGGPGKWLDIRQDAEAPRGRGGMGTVHHVAWQVENEQILEEIRRHLVEDLGKNVTEIKDRKYFRSIYFRIPGHVLFEIATLPPGFQVDEDLEALGQKLQLPPWEEPNRSQIESVLPELS